MQFLTPNYFGLSIFLVGIILFYLFRKQYDKHVISSTLLWHQVMQEWQATKWWRKLQRHLLMYLQLIILLLLMIALTRPFIGLSEYSGEHIIVIMDTSASMTAEEEESSRLQMAKEEVKDIIDQLDNQMMTVVLAEESPRILYSNETIKNRMIHAIEDLDTSYQVSDVNKAVQLANQILASSTGEIHVFSDRVEADQIRDNFLNYDLTIHNIGSSHANLSLHTFGVSEREGKVNGILTVNSEYTEEQLVRITIESDGEELRQIQELLEPNKLTQLSVEDLPTKPYYKAVITTNDDYQADNTSISFLQKTVNPSLYLVGDVNPFVVRALNYFKTDIIQVENGADVPDDATGIFILEDVPDDQWPNGPLFLLNPRKEGPFDVKEKQDLQSGLRVLKEDPLLNFVDLEEVYIQKSIPYESSQLETLVSTDDTPIISKGYHDGRPVIVLGVDIIDTDWPLHTGFPIFLYNSIQYLTEQQEILGYVKPNEQITIAYNANATQGSIVDENNDKLIDLNVDDGIFQAPNEPGLYRIQEIIGDRTKERLVAVTLDQEEHHIVPSESFAIELDQEDSSVNEQKPNEIWAWITIIAFIVLLLEWEVYRRGITN
ncbi:VWA domain-containing protein [Ornithinibacillus salinisoli]|uniref:VWA domain-containing protein n=1 Tax=Ornithinibacillus salinisoli TaxID=1848459 RepID=A0ABW4W2M6_9BACI